MSWLFALGYDAFMRRSEEACLRAWRKALLEPLRGVVLEIGAGSGANIPFYSPEVERLILTEPDRHMLAKARKVAGTTKRVELVEASADALPMPDKSVDVVVSTLVLCSVPDQARTLAEAKRVLKPGGKLVFLEHVAAEHETSRYVWQRRVEPIWSRLAGNCHLTRDTGSEIERAGFKVEALERESMRRALPLVRPTIRGVAILLTLAILLTGCPRPRTVGGTVYARRSADGNAMYEPVTNANVTWACSELGSPPPQVLSTDGAGHFRSKEMHMEMPGTCRLLVSKAGHTSFEAPFSELCGTRCTETSFAIVLPSAPTPTSATSADARSSTSVLHIELRGDGSATVNGEVLVNDEAVLPLARKAHANDPATRAILRAEGSVAYHRVIHMLDLLKAAQVDNVAFNTDAPTATPPTPRREK